MEEELNAIRRKQIEDQRIAYAFEIQREKEETEKIAKLNIEDIKKSKEMDERNRMVNNIMYCQWQFSILVKLLRKRVKSI